MAIRLSARDQPFGRVEAAAAGTSFLACITNKPAASSRWWGGAGVMAGEA